MSTNFTFRKRYLLSIYAICLLLAIMLIWGCGSSRQTTNMEGKEINLDELLGGDDVNSTEQDSEEAEVLRLLGITPAENTPQQTAFTNITDTPQQNSNDKEISTLEQELINKDNEIAILRTELTQKESKISEMETTANTSSRARPTVIPTGKSGGPSSEFKSRYQSGVNQFNARSYQGALTIFTELILSDPNNSLSDNCQYWIGECYYGLVNYNQAISEFEKVFSFPNSNKNDDAQLKLGICYLKLGDKQQARAEFDRLIANYPDSEYISVAQRYIGRL